MALLALLAPSPKLWRDMKRLHCLAEFQVWVDFWPFAQLSSEICGIQLVIMY
jgi:hypothetical protein